MGGRIRPSNTTVGSVSLWLSRLLSGVGACLNFVGVSERLSRTGTAHRKRTSCVSGVEWEEYAACCSGFPCRVYIDLNHRDSWI
jgi:hypothetical protein